MSERKPDYTVTEKQTAEEMAHIRYEPMLPAENWLVGSSLVLGIALLGLLLHWSATYFPMKAP